MTLIKRFFCKIGWHSIFAGFIYVDHDGVNAHAKCKWCGYKGLIDSHGQLF